MASNITQGFSYTGSNIHLVNPPSEVSKAAADGIFERILSPDTSGFTDAPQLPEVIYTYRFDRVRQDTYLFLSENEVHERNWKASLVVLGLYTNVDQWEFASEEGAKTSQRLSVTLQGWNTVEFGGDTMRAGPSGDGSFDNPWRVISVQLSHEQAIALQGEWGEEIEKDLCKHLTVKAAALSEAQLIEANATLPNGQKFPSGPIRFIPRQAFDK